MSNNLKVLKHYNLNMKVGETRIIDKFPGKILIIRSIITRSNDKAYEYIGNGCYRIKDIVINILGERELSKIEIPMNIHLNRLNWFVHDSLNIKLTTTDADINDNDSKRVKLIIEGELSTNEKQRVI